MELRRRSRSLKDCWCAVIGPALILSSSADESGAALAAQNGRNRTRLADREHDDRHTVFPGKREGRRVHDLEIALDRLLVGQTIVALSLRVLLRVRAVAAVA